MLKPHLCEPLYLFGPLRLHGPLYLHGPLHLYGPFIFMAPFIYMGPFTCMGPFRFRVAILRLYGPFTTKWGPFNPARPRSTGGGGRARGWSTPALGCTV